MATIKEVAKVSGVSVATVSRVLNNTAPVNAETRKRIEAVIKELDYTPSMIARGMRKQQSQILAVIIPDYDNPYHIKLYKHIEEEAKQYGYRLILICMQEHQASEYKSIMELMTRNVDGIILSTYQGNKKEIKEIIKLSKSIPIVFMDNFEFDEEINAVYINDYQGMKEIIEHVIALGHKNIGYIDKIVGYKVANERRKSYEDTLRNHAIAINKQLIYAGNYGINSGYEAARYFMEETIVTPTAIIASNDAMAVGVLGYLREHGYDIPRDVVVTGFDDIYLSKITVPPLTTYRQPLGRVAKEVIEVLHNKIKMIGAPPQKRMIEGKLIARGSTDASCKEKVFPIKE
ncbi:MAG: LacI family DNA-binding transcriptional regulator [Niameybacter sp.]